MAAVRVVDARTREVVAASYALPDLETAVQQAICNCIDARATAIKLLVDLGNASFTAEDDGDGIPPDDLYDYVGECYASSRVPSVGGTQPPQDSRKYYGKRGAFLYELASLATTVEIESRVTEHWTSYRKVFQDGIVVFNGRSKELRKAPGTKVTVSNLFGKLPVRRKDLSRNGKHRARLAQSLHSFCVSMSMIWPTLAFDVRFTGDDAPRSISITAAKSCRQRFLEVFGQMLGSELQYVSFSSKQFPFSIRGFIALIHDQGEEMAPGIKQAKAYYQFAFLENEWVEECQQVCSKVITAAALELLAAIPIFVLKIEPSSDQHAGSRAGKDEHVFATSPELFERFLFEFVKDVAAADANHAESLLLNKDNPRSDHQHAAYSEAIASSTPDTADYSAQCSYHDYQHTASGDLAPSVFLGCRSDEDCHSQFQDVHFDGGSGIDCSAHDVALPEVHRHRPHSDDTAFREARASAWNEADFHANYGECPSTDEEHFNMQFTQGDQSDACHACGHVNNARINLRPTSCSGNEDEFVVCGDEVFGQEDWEYMAPRKLFTADDHAAGLVAQHFSQSDTAVLTDIFFSGGNLPKVTQAQDRAISQPLARRDTNELPWLSSKPDTYDCADILLDLCDHQVIGNDTELSSSTDWPSAKVSDEREVVNDKERRSIVHQPRDKDDAGSLPASSTFNGERSEYFVSQAPRQPLVEAPKRWASGRPDRIEEMAAALRVGSVRDLKGLREVKISKSILATLQVIRQVDRKFILVKARTPRGSLLLCIDQHAADERVRLEGLEASVFGPDGSQRNVDVHEHEPPLVLLMNAKEKEILWCNEDLVRSWGFDFESVSSQSENSFLRDHNTPEKNREGHVLLHSTPKVEKRIANADDFREFLRHIAGTGGCSGYSHIRPPVITRLLHSRACRSAIMFGDWLSIGQCKALVEELKTCQLPFQCAHGRPSVVPLAEFDGASSGSTSSEA